MESHVHPYVARPSNALLSMILTAAHVVKLSTRYFGTQQRTQGSKVPKCGVGRVSVQEIVVLALARLDTLWLGTWRRRSLMRPRHTGAACSGECLLGTWPSHRPISCEQLPLVVQVPNYKVSSQTKYYDSQCRNPTYPVFEYLGPLFFCQNP